MELKLFDLPMNQVPFYYQTYEGEIPVLDEDGYETGETEKKYSNPVPVKARVSPNSGNAKESPFGADIVYDKAISTVQHLPIDEYSRLFIEVVPELDGDGSTKTEPDYKCVCVKHDLHRSVWAIRKIAGAVDYGGTED